MNTTIVVVQRHGDGRLYPPRWWDLPPQVQERLRGLAHHLRCVEHLSYREVQRQMLDRFGERRSLGQVWTDVHEFECPSCIPEVAPPPKPKARPVPWR
jgi:hypothetical protein